MTNSGGNCYLGTVLYFGLFWLFLLYAWTLYGFYDLEWFHSSAMVHEFLLSWWFSSFLRGWLILGGNCNFGVVLCFQLFWLFSCYKWALYRFHELRGLGSLATVLGFLESWWFYGSLGVNGFGGNHCFGVFLCFRLFWLFYGLRIFWSWVIP